MICPNCGGRAHRSHHRGLIELIFKSVSSYKPYRCSDCNWRGWAAHVRTINRKEMVRTVLFWCAALIIALAIGVYAVIDLRSTLNPQPVQHRER